MSSNSLTFATSSPYISSCGSYNPHGCTLWNQRRFSQPCFRLRRRNMRADMKAEPEPTSPANSFEKPANKNAAVNETNSPKLPGTPCFTARVLVSPMPRPDRTVYLDAVTSAVDAYLEGVKESARPPETSSIGQVTLLVPHLNPSLDVYDRRFLLQLVWAVLSSTVTTHGYRTRVLIQGRRAFGAIPLSIAGLRRHFDADLDISASDWSRTIRSGDLEDERDLDDDDDAIIIISPTNAVSLPVINSVVDLVRRAKGRPVIIVNPRLDDVPSHSGVMQVSGRSTRLAFLQTIDDIFYLRVLFDPGSSYPPRGILYRACPNKWQVWRAENVDNSYAEIYESDERPDISQISDAFKKDYYVRQKQLVQNSSEATFSSYILSPQFLVFVLVLAGLLVIPYFASTPHQQPFNYT